MTITYSSSAIQISGAETFDNLATYLNGAGSAYGSATESTIVIDDNLNFASGATLTKGTSRRNTIKFGNTSTSYRITSSSFTQANMGIIDYGTEGFFIFEGKGYIGNAAATCECRFKADYLTVLLNCTSSFGSSVDLFYRSSNDRASLDIAEKLTVVQNNSIGGSCGLLFDPSKGAIGEVEFLVGDNASTGIFIPLNGPDGVTIPKITFPIRPSTNDYSCQYFRNLQSGGFAGDVTIEEPTFPTDNNIIFFTWCSGTHNFDNVSLPSGYSSAITGTVSSLATTSATQQCRYSFTAPEFFSAGGWTFRMKDNTEVQFNDVSLASEHKIIWRKLVNANDDTNRTLTERTGAELRLRKQGFLDQDFSYTNYNARVDFLAPPVVDPLWNNTGTITEIDNAQELYDEYIKELNTDLSLDKDCTREGNQFSIADYDLILDSTASDNISIVDDTSVTAKTLTYTGGATATTGEVTVQGATALSGGTFDCDINYSSSATTITNVTNSQDTDFSGAGAGTYTISGGSLNTVTSSVSGVILNLTNGATITTNNSPSNITINTITSITLTGLVSNSEVRIYDTGTTTELAGVENSGTSFTDDISVSSVDIIVFALGYQPIRLEAVDTSENLTLPIQQVIDRVYENP